MASVDGFSESARTESTEPITAAPERPQRTPHTMLRGLPRGTSLCRTRATPPSAPGPCPTCHRQARCAAEQLACVAFRVFVRTGHASPFAPRQPSAAIYAELEAPATREPVRQQSVMMALWKLAPIGQR